MRVEQWNLTEWLAGFWSARIDNILFIILAIGFFLVMLSLIQYVGKPIRQIKFWR